MTDTRGIHRNSGIAFPVALWLSLPFLMACEKIPEPEGAQTRQQISSSGQPLTVGVFTFKVPVGWQVLSGPDEGAAKREIEKSVQQMITEFGRQSGSRQGLLGLEAFRAVRIAEKGGWFIVYTVRIPPQQDYLATMERDQREKLSWGQQQGIVTKINEHARRTMGDSEVIKVDTEMRGGGRNIGIYHWSPSERGLVGTITVTLDRGQYERVRSSLDTVMESIQIVEGRQQ